MGCSSSTTAAPTSPAQPVSAEEAAAAETLEEAGQISKEVFVEGLQKVLILVIDGYPRALQSTYARRNEVLRRVGGDSEKAADDIKAQAAALSEEGKTWLLSLVPYVGLPASLLYPTCLVLRRVCLLAGVFGHDLAAEETRAKILHAFAGGGGAVPLTEYALETAAQAVWKAFVGPVLSLVPVGTLVSKVANVEGTIADRVGRETFEEGRQPVPEEVYMQELDPVPTYSDYAGLAKDTVVSVLDASYQKAVEAMALARDKRERDEAVRTAQASGTAAAASAARVGQAAAVVATERGRALVGSIREKAGRPAPGAGSG